MTRKEWGMAMLAENKEDDDDIGESKEDKSKRAQEEKRKMYRESEKMMRERRCLIKPAPVAKRSIKDLIAKVEARVSKVAQETVAPALASEQADRATAAPQAPKSAESPAAPRKMQMDENDEDDDEIVIRGNTVPSTPFQLSRTAARKSADAGAAAFASPPSAKNATGGDASAAADGASAAHGKVKTPKKTNAPASKAALHVLSPPSARKKRANLRNQLLKTARSRSEHLIAAERAGIKVKRDAPPNFSDEINLEEQSDPFPNLTVAFIVSTKYVGHKKGYVFHMGCRGLGYYNEAVQKDEEEDEEQEQEQGVFHGASKTIKVKLVGNDAGYDCLTAVCTCRLSVISCMVHALTWVSQRVLKRYGTLRQAWKIPMMRCRGQPRRVRSVVRPLRRAPTTRVKWRPSRSLRNVRASSGLSSARSRKDAG